MELHNFIKPLGIGAYCLLLLTFSTGFFRWKFKYHKTLAKITLALASIHGLIIIFFD